MHYLALRMIVGKEIIPTKNFLRWKVQMADT